MPSLMAATKVSLRQLADLAIGTPEVGAVNFTALHTLIVAILRNLHLQDTVVDIQSLSPEQSYLFEAPRPSLSAVQEAVPKEKRKSPVVRTPSETLESTQELESGTARAPSLTLESGAPRAPAQARESGVARAPSLTLESQVQDLGGQVHDLGLQVKTMESQVQGILTHVQHVTALASRLDIDAPEWLEEQEMAMPMPDMAKLMPEKATSKPDKATPDKERMGLTRIRKDRPRAVELLQNVMEDVKTLKEAHEKAQGAVQEEFPELSPQKLLQRIEEVESKLRDREEFLELLTRKVSSIPAVEDATMVTWEDLEQAITDGWKATQVVNKWGAGAG